MFDTVLNTPLEYFFPLSVIAFVRNQNRLLSVVNLSQYWYTIIQNVIFFQSLASFHSVIVSQLVVATQAAVDGAYL